MNITIKRNILIWVDYVVRMGDSERNKRIVNKVRREQGRPKLRWVDGRINNLRNLRYKNWKTAAQDRTGLPCVFEEARAHLGLLLMIMRMIKHTHIKCDFWIRRNHNSNELESMYPQNFNILSQCTP